MRKMGYNTRNAKIARAINSMMVARNMIRDGYTLEIWREEEVAAVKLLQEMGIPYQQWDKISDK